MHRPQPRSVGLAGQNPALRVKTILSGDAEGAAQQMKTLSHL